MQVSRFVTATKTCPTDQKTRNRINQNFVLIKGRNRS